jgi:hypothetical protein
MFGEIWWITRTTFLILSIYEFVLYVLNWALRYRWLFPIVTIPFIGFLLLYELQDFKSPQLTIRGAVSSFCITVLIAAIGFGSLSLWLANLGWANHTPENLGLFAYNNYYLWQFLDLIPLLKVNDTLGLGAPLQPVGFVAGLPVLAFRALILFVLLKRVREWWAGRNKKSEGTTKPQNSTETL